MRTPIPAAEWRLRETARRFPRLDQEEFLARRRALDLEWLLKRVFGKPAFKPGQREAVERLLKGEDAVVLLPTGSGKSLIYQLAALLSYGTALVVSPTVALMEDQVRGLREAGVRGALAFSRGMGEEASRRALERLAAGRAALCYASPERFLVPGFRRALSALAARGEVSFLAFDEAHCVSQWGHDFRPSYLAVARSARRICGRIPVAALTATASPETLADLRALLGLEEAPLVAPGGLERPELSLVLERCRPARRTARLMELARRPGAGIIFAPHVEGPHGARAVAAALGTEAYHGKPPRGVGEEAWSRERRAIAGRFLAGETRVLAATKAFGLGIDKRDVRWIVHAGLPPSAEAFWQEAGRAGRDGRAAECRVLVAVEDFPRARLLLDPGTPHAEALAGLERVAAGDDDDATRALRLHARAFPGPAREYADLEEVLWRLGDLAAPGPRTLSMPYAHQPLIEKALHRLLRLGVLSDYSVRHELPAFEPVLTGEPFRAEEARALLERGYAETERGRRRSLSVMLEACRPGAGDLRAAVAAAIRPGR